MKRFEISGPALCELPLIEAAPAAGQASQSDNRQSFRRAFGWHKPLAEWIGVYAQDPATGDAEAKG